MCVLQKDADLADARSNYQPSLDPVRPRVVVSSSVPRVRAYLL